MGDLLAPANRRQITIGTTLFFLQQMTGINAVAGAYTGSLLSST
jgi:hypothetical protein